MMKSFNVGIKALIVRDGKILMLRRAGDNPYWDVPGGRIDDDESVEQTLDRELHEELPNLATYHNHGLLYVSRLHKDIKPGLSLFLVFYRVKASFTAGEPQLSAEHSEYRWVDKPTAIDMADTACKEALARL